MLCSKKGCNKKIPQGEEVQIEGTVICKECSEKPIAYCATCSPERPLYNNDKIHEIYRDWGRDYNIWVLLLNIKRSKSEKITQCDECYQDWKKEKKEEGKMRWNKKVKKELCSIFKEELWLTFFTILLIVSLGLGFYLFYEEKYNRLKKELIITIIFAICLSMFLNFLLRAVFEEDDRFKTRKRDKERKKENR